MTRLQTPRFAASSILEIRAAACVAPVLVAVVTLGGCRSPLDGGPGVEPIARVMRAAVDREIEASAAESRPRTTSSPVSPVEEALAGRRTELDALGPAGGAVGATVDVATLGDDLVGERQQVVEMDLSAAVLRAVSANLGVEQARLQPSIDAQDVIDAEAVFDWVFFASADLVETDRPAVVRTVGNVPVTPPFTASRSYRYATGVNRAYDFGGRLSVQVGVDRDENRVSGSNSTPDPAYPAGITLGFEQPLLRDFGRDVNRASIRLARNTRARSVAELERSLLDATRAVEAAYFDLTLAWRRLETTQWLVAVGIEVRDVLDQRRAFDARDAQFADAVARVEQRKADVIRARRAVESASDALKVLMNDPQLSIGSEALLRPTLSMDPEAFTFDLREELLAAIDRRPEIAQSLLAVDDASILRQVADNGVLPRLDLTTQLAWRSLGDTWDEALQDTLDDSFVEYVLGLRFEMPIGNRGPEAQARRARLVRARTLAGYREAVQTVVADVKAALRDVEANYELISATRSFRVAQAENLRALLVEKQTLAGLTPEFLNLEFNRQETLASARVQEYQAEVDFRESIAALARATGTSLDRYGIEFEAPSGDGPIVVPGAGADDAAGMGAAGAASNP